MNLREGTRRLALLLGVVGALVGGFVSYMELQSVTTQRESHNRFVQLANSDVVQQLRKNMQSPPKEPTLTPDQAIQAFKRLPEDRQRAILARLSPEVKQRIMGRLKEASSQPSGALAPNTAPAKFDPHSMICPLDTTDPSGCYTQVDKGSIRTIYWSNDYGVKSIETEAGQTLYPTPAPSAWLYLLIALFPVLGFFIPWGATRSIGWVGAGFVAGSK